jgi:hypothetical protein
VTRQPTALLAVIQKGSNRKGYSIADDDRVVRVGAPVDETVAVD